MAKLPNLMYFLRFEYIEAVAFSYSFLFSWLRHAHTNVIVIVALPNFIYFSDTNTTRPIHPIVCVFSSFFIMSLKGSYMRYSDRIVTLRYGFLRLFYKKNATIFFARGTGLNS